MAREPPNRCKLTTNNAMDKLKESVLRLCSSRSSPLTPSEVEDRLRSLFASPQLLRTPDHPPYSEMISAAIRELNERGGSKEGAISSYIEGKYEDLPFAHPRLLAHHLGVLMRSGEIVLCGRLRYGLPKGNAASPSCERRLPERSEKWRKRSRSRGGDDKVNCGGKQLPLAPLEELENPDVLFKKPRTRGGCGVKKLELERLGGEELGSREENALVMGGDANVNGGEHLQEANEEEELHHGAVESVVEDRRVESSVCVVSCESELIPVFETEFLESNLEKQIELQSPSEQHGERESVAKTMASVDDDNNDMPEHGKQEKLVIDQTMTSASDGIVLRSQLESMSVIETEPLQNLNAHNEPLEPGRSNDIHEPEQQLKDQMAALKGEEATSVFQMEQLESSNNQNEPPLEQQGEKTENGHRGRPDKERSVEDHEMQELLVEGHTTTSMGDENSVLQSEYRHDEQQPLQKPESQQQLEGGPLPKKKDGRGRPRKEKPKFEEQLKVAPLQKKKDGRGRPKKKQPESEQQLLVARLQKKNDCRVRRPVKKKLKSEQGLGVDPVPEKNVVRRRPVKKKLESEQQLEPESEQRLDVDPSPKKNVGRVRPGKKKLESEQQLEHESEQQLGVDQLQKKNDGRGWTPMKKILESEQQLEVGPLQKKKDGEGRAKKKKVEIAVRMEKRLEVGALKRKKDGRGRPKKNLESEQQSELDSLQKKKDDKGRFKKKKPEFAVRVEKQLELGPLKKKKDGRGRPRMKPESEQQLKVDPLPKKKDSRGRPKKKEPESEQQSEVDSLQKKNEIKGRSKKKKPESEQQLEVDPLPKKKDSRVRPKKKEPESEQRSEVDSLQKKDESKGRSKKKKPESEQQLQVDPLPKKKDSKGRPRKKKTSSEPQLAVDPLQEKNDDRGRPEKEKPESEEQLAVDPLPKKTESEPQIAVDPLQEKNDSRDSGPEKEKPESEVQLAVDFSQKIEDYRGRPKRKRPESKQVAGEPLQKKKDGRGRPMKKTPDSEQQGEEQLLLLDEKIVGSVFDNDFTSKSLAELFLKWGSGNLKKNKDSMELLEKQQLPRRSLGRPSRKRKELEASNAGVDDGENSLQIHSEVPGGSLATESVPSQDLVSEMVKDQLMDPPRKKRSKTTVKHLKEPLLPRRQLRPKNPL
ncbi:hypothetical protein Scep_019153 [Stephania cephalantha]|uniref:H15 domain-containing protein n=1 Tax=Stephania cephalantha TaxID=152367 RepID=A0AAP0IA75_9MAGN